MGWTEVAAGLGTSTAIAGLKAAKDQMGKRQYKRLLATTVAQILELHPDISPAKARRRARRITGARPSKKLLRPGKQVGLKEGAEGAVAAVATAGAVKVAEIFGTKLKDKLSGDNREGDGEPEPRSRAEDEGVTGGVRH
jgi:hypothetical protein